MSHAEDPVSIWWTAFQQKVAQIEGLFSGAGEWDLAGWMHEHLGPVSPDLMWEFGPALGGEGHRLVITPETRRDLRPLVTHLLERAPRLAGWEFYGYRPREDYDEAVQTVEGRTGGDITQTFFRASVGEFHRIDLTFFAAHYAAEDPSALNDVFIATETLLGEEVLDKWIGVVETGPPEGAGNDPLQPIRHLAAEVDALIERVRRDLPDRLYHELDKDEVTLFELHPDPASDYPEQSDLAVKWSAIPEMWRNSHLPIHFDSERFSRHGETFCYVKIDGTEGLGEEVFADRAEIEEALDEALRRERLGCVVGGGTGLRYSYVDMALVDVEAGSRIVRRVLQDGKVPTNTWLLFFDSVLQSRWIGIWPDTPMPPMRDLDEEAEEEIEGA